MYLLFADKPSKITSLISEMQPLYMKWSGNAMPGSPHNHFFQQGERITTIILLESQEIPQDLNNIVTLLYHVLEECHTGMIV